MKILNEKVLVKESDINDRLIFIKILFIKNIKKLNFINIEFIQDKLLANIKRKIGENNE